MKSIYLPDEIYARAVEFAERDNVSVDKFIAALVHQHAIDWEELQGRARRGSLGKFKAVLSKVRDNQPEPLDRHQ